MTIRVLLVERPGTFTDALEAELVAAQVEVVAVVSTGRDAIAFLERDRPDAIVMDLELPVPRVNLRKRRPMDGDGVALGLEIRKHWPEARMILLSRWVDFGVAARALSSGFHGHLVKDSPVDELVRSIRDVANGERVFSERLLSDETPEPYPDLSKMPEPPATLTRLEREVFDLLVEGANTRKVARRLGMSPAEAGIYVRAILRKLGLS